MYFKPAIVMLICAHTAYAWSGEEHARIGATAYATACASIEAAMSEMREPVDPGIRQRFAVACRSVPETPGVTDKYALQGLFGDWSAIAADHADTPSQLTNLMLSDRVVDYRKYARLAMTNYRHFHPAVVNAWHESHVTALQTALNASATGRLNLPQAYESALAVEAFAEHYLQDAFSAGHMGFNRVASSNAAALSFHNRASRRGRCVANLNSELWFTYGDNHLTDNLESWQHVVVAATASLTYFITTFVNRAIDPDGVDTVAAKLPAFVKETGSEQATGCEYSGKFISLRSVGLPAKTATTWDFWFVRDATAYYSKPTMGGYMFGGSLEFAPISIGYRRIQNRFQVGIGRTFSEIGPHAWLFDVQYLWHLGTSNRGIITHELGIGEGDYWANSVHYEQINIRAIYNANVEAGRTYMRIQLALARSEFRWGPYIAVGVGTVRRASK